jgi:hypothetical protein
MSGEHSSDKEDSDQYDFTQLLYQTTHKISDSKDKNIGDSHDTGNERGVKNIFMARYQNIYWSTVDIL